MTTGSTSSEPTIGEMMPAAVIAPTDTDPIAKCSTAAMHQASRMLMITGAFSSAENRSLRVASMPLAAMTAPRDPPTPVTSRISPVVWNPDPRTFPTPSAPMDDRTIPNAISSPRNSAMLASPRKANTEFEASATSRIAPLAIRTRGTRIGNSRTHSGSREARSAVGTSSVSSWTRPSSTTTSGS